MPLDFGTEQQWPKTHSCEVHCINLWRIQTGFEWPSAPVLYVNQDLLQSSTRRFFAIAFNLSFIFLIAFSFSFPFGALWRWHPLPIFLAFSKPHRRSTRACLWVWLQNRSHVVPKSRALVERIIEVPILFVDELADLLHQKAVCQHEFGESWRTKPAVVCVLLSIAGQKFGVKRLVRSRVASSTKGEGVTSELHDLGDAPGARWRGLVDL